MLFEMSLTSQCTGWANKTATYLLLQLLQQLSTNFWQKHPAGNLQLEDV